MKQAIIQNLFVTAGKATLGLIVSIGAGVINIIFDYVFIVSTIAYVVMSFREYVPQEENEINVEKLK